eukprot:6416879-Pyramimonas_sp.AAC.1
MGSLLGAAWELCTMGVSSWDRSGELCGNCRSLLASVGALWATLEHLGAALGPLWGAPWGLSKTLSGGSGMLWGHLGV